MYQANPQIQEIWYKGIKYAKHKENKLLNSLKYEQSEKKHR